MDVTFLFIFFVSIHTYIYWHLSAVNLVARRKDRILSTQGTCAFHDVLMNSELHYCVLPVMLTFWFQYFVANQEQDLLSLATYLHQGSDLKY